MPKQDKDIAIKVNHVSKDFKLPHDSQNSIKGRLINFRKQGYEVQHALKDISFEVNRGDFFGIVGRNGSGKSTLLKMLAGIYTPTSGTISINGKLTPFIELGVGFNPELSGRDNVFLNGALLGFNRNEMAALYDEIVTFAELDRFMDQKLKNYSSGMQVRLAFSIAIQADTDILVLDEVLAVGDEAFQKKCFAYFAELKRNKKTVILVTHSMDSVQQFCNKAMLIDKGHKTVVGSTLEITQIYKSLNDQDNITVNDANSKLANGSKFIGVHGSVTLSDKNADFELLINAKSDMNDIIVAFEIFRDTGEQLIRWVSDENSKTLLDLKNSDRIRLSLQLQNIFPVGIFTSRLTIKKRDRSREYGVFNNIVSFEIKNNTPYNGNIFLKPNQSYEMKINSKLI